MTLEEALKEIERLQENVTTLTTERDDFKSKYDESQESISCLQTSLLDKSKTITDLLLKTPMSVEEKNQENKKDEVEVKPLEELLGGL